MSNFKLISRPLGTVQCFVLQRDDGAEFEILSGYGAGLNAWRIPDNKGKLQDLLFGYREGDDIFKMGPTQTRVADLPRSRDAWHTPNSTGTATITSSSTM